MTLDQNSSQEPGITPSASQGQGGPVSTGASQGGPESGEGFVQKPLPGPAVGTSQVQPAANLPADPLSMKKSFYQANKLYVWAIVVAAVIIGVLAFFAFRKVPVQPTAEANVSITADAPGIIPSGSEVIYRIKVENQDAQKLVGMQLELTYPSGFSYLSSNPDADNLSGNLFKVPDLSPKQNAVIMVKVRASGSINDQKTLAARLHYHFANFSSEFVKQQDFTSTIGASDLALDIKGPETTSASQLISYTVSFQNNSNQDIKNARLVLTYPEGFSFASADPQPDLGNNTWNVSRLFTNASSTFRVQGTYKSINPGESKTVKAEFQVMSNSGTFSTQAVKSFTTSIASLPLLVSQSVEQSNGSGIINPGDQLTFKIRYQNNAATAASGVNVQVQIDSKAVDLSSLRAEGAQVNNNSITWNAASVSQLQNLSPSESGELSYSVRVNSPATKDSSKNLSVISRVKISANEYQTPFPGEDLTLKISSPSSLSASLGFIGGQLPPKVGVETVYQVTLKLANSTNDFSNTQVTAFVPLGAGGFVTDSFNLQEASRAAYDPATGKLTWTVGNLPAHTGQFTAARSLTFKVKLNPSSSQAGQSPVLVKDIKYQATDTYTNQQVQGSAQDLTTNDLSGQNNYTSGQVER